MNETHITPAEKRVKAAAARWLACSPQSQEDALILASFASGEIMSELSGLRHACIAAAGFLCGVSVLDGEQMLQTIRDAIKPYLTAAKEQNR